MLTETLPAFADILSFVGCWWLVQTKPQMERRLARELSAANVQYVLPSEQITKIEHDREGRAHRRKVERLYFPGYVFLCTDANGRYFAARSFATSRTIAIFDQARFVKQLDSLQIALTVNPQLRAIEGLARGKYVRVADGPYMGMVGQVEDLRAAKMIVQVGLSMLGRIVPVEIPAEYVEAA